MNNIHDMGGMQGFGPVIREENEPVFHADWERRVLGVLVTVACNGHFNFDQSRNAIEQMTPADYLTTSYYEHWLFGLERIVKARGLLSGDEIAECEAQIRAQEGK